tara:strand:+ start:1580 stop:2413 length:834 start_codon:yes stop_codon:yes gene_type:complete
MKIGVMQGRLLPKYKGRYQAHPQGYWQKEFFLAKKLGLDFIEFILDFEDFERNPLHTESGVKQILNISKKTGVAVNSICADYFMHAPIHSENKKLSRKSIDVLIKLLFSSKKLKITDIVIPCVDQSALKGDNDIERLLYNLKSPLILANKFNINLALETDLPPLKFKDLLSRFDNYRITVNYDLGNSASLGYRIEEEFEAYARKISCIHIKDRVLNGGSVILGDGDVNFQYFKNFLKNSSFDGPIIMQAYRDDEGVEIFSKQLKWFKNLYYDCGNSS